MDEPPRLKEGREGWWGLMEFDGGGDKPKQKGKVAGLDVVCT